MQGTGSASQEQLTELRRGAGKDTGLRPDFDIRTLGTTACPMLAPSAAARGMARPTEVTASSSLAACVRTPDLGVGAVGKTVDERRGRS